jgi:hypothetical protein
MFLLFDYVQIEQCLGLGKWHKPPEHAPRGKQMATRNGYVTNRYVWHDAYLAALRA